MKQGPLKLDGMNGVILSVIMRRMDPNLMKFCGVFLYKCKQKDIKFGKKKDNVGFLYVNKKYGAKVVIAEKKKGIELSRKCGKSKVVSSMMIFV